MTEGNPSTETDLNPLSAARREAKTALAAVAVFSACINLLVLVSPLYMFQIFDRVLTSGRVETLLYLTLVVIVALALFGALEAIRAVLLARVAHWLERRLSPGLLLQSLNHQGSNGLLRDFMQVLYFVGSPGVTPFFDAPWVPFFIVVMYLLHPWLGVLALLSAILLTAIAYVNELRTRSGIDEALSAQGRVQQSLTQAEQHGDVVAAMNLAPALSRRLVRPLDEAQDQLQSAADTNGIALGLSKSIRVVAQVIALGLGAYLVLQGDLSPGGMIAASIILGRALAPVEQAIGAWRGFTAARASYGRLTKAFDAAPSVKSRMQLPSPKGELRVEDASYAPPGVGSPILKRITFSSSPGQVVGVVGPSAAGKSLLCRLLVGIASPQRGSVRLDGAEINHWDRAQLASAVGYLPQGVELFDGTVRENIGRMGDVDDAAVVEAAQIAGAHEMILELPQAYDTPIGPDGGLLSAGQRQRIGLARALFGNPKFLVLDEPNSNLDEDGERGLLRAILHMKQQGCNVILVAHRRTVLQVVDMLLFMRQGAVEQFGPRDEVVAAIDAQRVARQSVSTADRGTRESRPDKGGAS